MKCFNGSQVKYSAVTVAGLLLIMALLLGTVSAALADAPGVPNQFYGTVTINGSPAGQGITITAVVNGVNSTATSTDSDGRYGYNPVYMVAGSAGASVTFLVNGVQAAQTVTFQSGGVTPLGLTVSGSGSSSNQTTTPTGNTISTNILSQVDSLALNTSNVLPSAKLLNSADGRVVLSFPAGTTVNLAGQSSLGVANESNPASTGDGSVLIRAYSFSPSGASFSPAITITLAYDVASLPAGANESGVYIAWYTGSAWQSLPSTVNATTHQVTAATTHFTIFAVRYLTPTSTTPPATTDNSTTTTTTPATSQTGTINTNLLGSAGTFGITGGVATAGANLSSANGKLSFILSANTTVNLQGLQQLTIVQLASPPPAPANAKMIEAYSCSPDNATFSPSATLTLKYDPTIIPADVQEQNLYLALLQNASWSPLTSTVNTQAKTITAQVSHFSTYGLLGPVTATQPQTPVTPVTPAPIEAFSYSDLTVSPQAPGTGQPVTVSVRVVNGGSAVATDNVVLKINDKNAAQKQVTLSPGKSQLVTFDVTGNSAGKYTAQVGGQTISFEVAAATGNAPAGLSIPVLIVVVAGGLLVIILVIWLVVRQRQSY
jgi:hypothetical protein